MSISSQIVKYLEMKLTHKNKKTVNLWTLNKNINIHNENNDLQERVNNLSYILADYICKDKPIQFNSIFQFKTLFNHGKRLIRNINYKQMYKQRYTETKNTSH